MKADGLEIPHESELARRLVDQLARAYRARDFDALVRATAAVLSSDLDMPERRWIDAKARELAEDDR